MPDYEIDPQELKRRLDAGEAVRLIDVREPVEHQAARIEGAELIPMRTVPDRLADLEGEQRPVIVFCHHGVRSLRVVSWLREQGVANCTSLRRGIDGWSLEIDSRVPRYE
jgi:rhodanese-related sulfurtransferase